MFFSSFFNTPYKGVNNPFKVDIHSHLLPGIDDGVQTLKESVALIKQFSLLGYTRLITTPHIISDCYPNTEEIITNKLNIVRNALKLEKIEITLDAAAEYYVDMNFLNLIEERKLLTFMDHYVLFETAYTEKPIILDEIIYRLLENGYIPVLAHPERYTYLYNDIEKYKKLKAQGVLFQVNAKSLYNKSKASYKIAYQLIKLGLVDFIGSDAHRMRDLQRLEFFLKNKICRETIHSNNIKNNFKIY